MVVDSTGGAYSCSPLRLSVPQRQRVLHACIARVVTNKKRKKKNREHARWPTAVT